MAKYSEIGQLAEAPVEEIEEFIKSSDLSWKKYLQSKEMSL